MDPATRAYLLEVIRDLHRPQQRLGTATQVLLELWHGSYESRVGIGSGLPYESPTGTDPDWPTFYAEMNQGFLLHADRTDAEQELVKQVRQNLAGSIGEEPRFTIGDTFHGQELIEWCPSDDQRFREGQIEIVLPHVSHAVFNEVFADLAAANRNLGRIASGLSGHERDLIVGQQHLLNTVRDLDNRDFVEARDGYLDQLCTTCGIVRGHFEILPPIVPGPVDLQPSPRPPVRTAASMPRPPGQQHGSTGQSRPM